MSAGFPCFLFPITGMLHVVALGAPTPPEPPDPMLSLDRIYSQNEFREEKPEPFHWREGAPGYYTLDPARENVAGPVMTLHDPATGAGEVVIPAKAFIPPGADKALNIESFAFSRDEARVLLFTNSSRVWRRNTRGDYWVLQPSTGELKKLGGDAAPSSLMFAKFSPDGTQAAYVRENNLYVQETASMSVTSLTTTGSKSIINGTADWVNEEELDLRDGFRWSPDGRSIAFWEFDTKGVGEFHLIDNTAGIYPKITSFPYPKVGEKNSAVRLGVVRTSGGPVTWLQLPGDPREHYLPRMEWTPDGTRILVQQLNRLQNQNKVYLANPETGAAETILTESDPAWVENENPVRWLEHGRAFVWLSERDGWRHAYVAGVDGKRFTRITEGNFDIIDIEAVDETGGWLYYLASPENATQRYLYRSALAGGSPERLSPAAQAGWHTYAFSPDNKQAVHTWSSFSSPPMVELITIEGHQTRRLLTDNQKLREKLDTLKKPAAEFLRLDIGEGTVLDAWCLKPAGLDPAGKYPLLFHVYGEPAGQTVKDSWQGKTLLWHWMLAQQGCIVCSVDNRGTMAPRGRAWRKVVYRQIGILAAAEQAAAAKALLQRWPFVDSSRIGIWGWSGGGSMSLNAIFRYPDLYHTAIAVAPNASQLLYDTIYQERYMGLPADNAEGYRNGSPLNFAHQLKGNLLVVHGTGDDNGHFQGTEMLMNELIAHGKPFTVMPYPARSHAISEGRNTTVHFQALLTNYLRTHLLPTTP